MQTSAVACLSVLALALTVLEQWRYASNNRDNWMTVAAPSGAFVLTWLFTGSFYFAIATAIALGGVSAVLLAMRNVQSGLWKALANLVLPYMGLFAAWLPTQPILAPWITSIADRLWVAATGSGSEFPPVFIIKISVVLAAYIFNWSAGTFFTRSVLNASDPSGRAGETLPPEPVMSSGRMIGNLERFLVLTFMLNDQVAAIGLIMAAKSIVRFEFARERGEYYLVGTLSSLGISIAVGTLTNAILNGLV